MIFDSLTNKDENNKKFFFLIHDCSNNENIKSSILSNIQCLPTQIKNK